jgi:hypothetical protein
MMQHFVWIIARVLSIYILCWAMPAEAADNRPLPLLCPQSESRYLYQDNLVFANNSNTKRLVRTAVIAAELVRGTKVEGFLYLDNRGEVWIEVAKSADPDIARYYPGLIVGTSPVPLSTFNSDHSMERPPGTEVTRCPT